MKQDEYFMNIALTESKKARAISSPNPDVGAVIVKNNKIIGKGFTQQPGKPHAEVMAIKNAKYNTKDATMYVTLEPCSHYGKTPPCTDLIIKQKFKRVIIGIIDPNPLVQGKGVMKLRKAGIKVKIGILKNKIENSLQWFIKYITKKSPYITLKSGITLDAKITDYKGNSKWITSEKARDFSQNLRYENDGIIVGINTILNDNPFLTYRKSKNKPGIFYRIIFDSNLRIPLNSNVLKKVNGHKTLIITGQHSKNKKKFNQLLKSAEVITVSTNKKKNYLNIKEALSQFAKKGIAKLILEGGAELNFSFLKANAVDKLILFIAPILLGGTNSKSFISGKGLELKNPIKIKNGFFYNKLLDNFIFEGIINYYVYRNN